MRPLTPANDRPGGYRGRGNAHAVFTVATTAVCGVQLSRVHLRPRNAALCESNGVTFMQAESQASGSQASDDEVSRYIEQIKKKNNLDDAKLTEALKAQGMTMDAYRTQVRREIQKSQLVARQLRNKVNVTPEEVERYYEAHKADYSSGESVRVHHIFFRLAADASSDDVASPPLPVISVMSSMPPL